MEVGGEQANGGVDPANEVSNEATPEKQQSWTQRVGQWFSSVRPILIISARLARQTYTHLDVVPPSSFPNFVFRLCDQFIGFVFTVSFRVVAIPFL